MFATTTILGIVCLALLAIAALLFSDPGFKLKSISKIIGACSLIAAAIGAIAGVLVIGSPVLHGLLGAEIGFLSGIVFVIGLAFTGKKGPY